MIEDRAIASCPMISIKIRKIKGGWVVDVDDGMFNVAWELVLPHATCHYDYMKYNL